MKKKIVIMMMLLLASVGAMAQEVENPVGKFSVIPRVGVALSNWSNNSIYVSDALAMKSSRRIRLASWLVQMWNIVPQSM